MTASRLVTAALVISLVCGSALATEVDQTGSLSETLRRGMVLTATDATPSLATLPELTVVADVPRRGFYASRKDKLWDPRVCTGC